MSVIIASVSSGILAFWASKERAKKKHAQDNVETLRSIPDVPISGLRDLSGFLPHEDAKKLVFLRGVVLPRSSVNNLGSTTETEGETTPVADTLRSDTTGQEVVVIEDRVTHLHNESSKSIIGRSQIESKKVISRTRRQVPFVIASHISNPCNHYVYVSFDGTTEDQVPLERVCSDKKELVNRAYNNGRELTIDVLSEEEVLPLGTVVTALGLLSSENGIPTIKPFKELPLFLTTKSKKQLIEQISAEVDQVTSRGELLSRMSVGLAGFAIGTIIIHLVRELK